MPPFTLDTACEDALNDQIAREYETSLLYHGLSCRFANKELSLPGLARMFRRESDEEKDHAQAIMDYVHTRGGNVRMRCMSVTSDPTLSSYPSSSSLSSSASSYADKCFSEALHAVYASYVAEMENLRAIQNLHSVASGAEDVHLTDWISENLLREQMTSVSRQLDLFTRLRRLSPGVGLDMFDKDLLLSAD